MIRLIEINKMAAFFKVPAETIEKDYIISWILECFSKSEIKENFIFYGGTAIKRIYFEDHRFSEDIDLISSKKFSLNQILEMTKSLEHAKNNANIILEVDPNEIIIGKSRIQLYINYQGFEEIIGAPKKILVDFNMDMDLFGKSFETNMIESYSDLKGHNTTLNVQTLNTILANKLGMLYDLSRNEPRDLYDIWFLLQRKDKFNFDFNEICTTIKEKYGFTLSVNSLISTIKNNVSFKQNWTTRLHKQMYDLPDVNKVIYDITKILETWQLDLHLDDG